MRVALDAIRLDGGTQPRGMINFSVVEEYKTEMESGARFPPVTLFFDGKHHWLSDGYHRYHAAQDAGATEIEADVRQGTREDAVWYSCSANKGHGLRRTNADKRRAVETALRLRPDASSRAIAEHVGVGDQLVNDVRREMAPQLRDSRSSGPVKRIGQDGKARSLPAPRPKPPATKTSPPPEHVNPAPDRPHGTGDGDHDEPIEPAQAPRSAPATTSDTPAKPSATWLNERDRIVAEIVNKHGSERAREIARLILKATERAA